MLLRLSCLALLLLLPRMSLAVDAWDDVPAGCPLDKWSDVEGWRSWASHTPPLNAAHWAEERPRYANNREVWRWYDRLYISVMDGKVLTLTDCPFGDNMHYYTYERYDEPGGFHVVHAWRYEAHAYALAMRNTGKIYGIPGLPVSSPDGARFAYAVCSPPDGTTDEGEAEIGVMRIVDNRLRMEAKAEMPCSVADCKLDWEDDATVNAVCEDPRDSSKPWVMRLSRQDYGWASKASNR